MMYFFSLWVDGVNMCFLLCCVIVSMKWCSFGFLLMRVVCCFILMLCGLLLVIFWFW